MRLVKDMLFLMVCGVAVSCAQPNSLKSDTSKLEPSSSAGLHLNAKSVLLQTSSFDEAVDTNSGFSLSPLQKPIVVDSIKTSRDSLAMLENHKIACPVQGKLCHDKSTDCMAFSEVLKTKEMLADLGKFHKLMGSYGALCGALGIVAGVMLIDKADDAVFAMSFITLGGISIGFGLWEIQVGTRLQKFQVADK